jgi:Ni,Fe-hydrogenase maturation factor
MEVVVEIANRVILIDIVAFDHGHGRIRKTTADTMVKNMNWSTLLFVNRLLTISH